MIKPFTLYVYFFFTTEEMACINIFICFAYKGKTYVVIKTLIIYKKIS